MDVQGLDPARREIVCTSTGYHPLTRRKVGLSLAGGVLSLHEDGRGSVISRAGCRPISWVGQNKTRPMVPLAGMVLDGEKGPWVVVTTDMTIDLERADEHATPHPHVFVSGEDLAAMAAACGIGSLRKQAPQLKVWGGGSSIKWIIGLVVLGGLVNFLMIMKMKQAPSEPEDCSRQRQPAQELYPRMSCAEARAEVDRVARGEAEPRSIVLRPVQLTIDARDVVGPGKILCDGIEFAVQDANQANPDAPIVYNPGPHAVLAGVLPDGRLSRPQYVICGNIVAREQRGEMPP
jgi:hypothetical protein